MALFQNLTASTLIKTGAGKLFGFIINSHTSGTIRLNDGLTGTTSAGVKATQTLTASGVFSDGETITIDGTVYTMKTTLTNLVPNEVLIGASTAIALDNLKQAINQGDTEGDGAGQGTTYSTGTVPHPTVTATTNGATTQVVQARDLGTAGNAIVTTETGANCAWGAGTLASGVDVNRLLMNTYTPPAGSQVVMFPEPVEFAKGLYFTEGGTTDITFLYK